MPVVVIGVHDGADTACVLAGESRGRRHPSGLQRPRWWVHELSKRYQQGLVEVQTCYHFKSILELPLFSLGNVWIQRTRTFTIPCWFVLIEDECGA